jgi:hypothetical protein
MENHEADPKGFFRTRGDPQIVPHCQQILIQQRL